MITYLKIKRNTLAFEAQEIRNYERHTLANGRALAGRYHRKHDKDEEVPKMPPKTEKALALEESARKSQEAYDLFWGLQHHRKNVVRKEARDTHIALHFLKGGDYSVIERKAYQQPNWDNIERMVLKYAEDEDIRITKQRFEEWCQGIEKYIGTALFTMSHNPSRRMRDILVAKTRTIPPRK